MVRKGGLEPPHLSVPDPKSGASANSATFATQLTCGEREDSIGKQLSAVASSLGSGSVSTFSKGKGHLLTGSAGALARRSVRSALNFSKRIRRLRKIVFALRAQCGRGRPR